MRTDLHTKTAIRPNTGGALVPLLIAVIALILSGCTLSSPAEFIKDQMARGTGGGVGPSADDADFPGGSIDSIVDIYSGGVTLYNHLNGIKNTPGNYVINLHGGQTHNFLSSGITLGNGVNISLRGAFTDTVLNSSYGGALFTINGGANLTLRGPTLRGWTNNTNSVVYVTGGAFSLRSGVITGNTRTTGSYGGGVYVHGGSFTMFGGTVSGNTTTGGGGGVCVDNSGTFTMKGGNISDNTVSSGNGGGVNVISGSFTMSGGTISSGNTASNGGGVCIGSGANFGKTGGTVTGTDGPDPNSAFGNGDAVYYVGGTKYRDTTAGPGAIYSIPPDPDADGTGFWQHSP